MDYEKEIASIDDYIRREHYKQAGNALGGILEEALRELYNQVKVRCNPDQTEQLVLIEKKHGKGKAASSFGLGQLFGLFREGRVLKLVQTLLNKNLVRAHRLPYKDMIDIRNRAVHPVEDQQITLDDLEFFLANLKVFLRETGFIRNGVRERVADSNTSQGVRESASVYQGEIKGQAQSLRTGANQPGLSFIDRFAASEILHKRLSQPDIREIVIFTYTNEVEGSVLDRYHVCGEKHIVVVKRSIVSDLAEQQKFNIDRLLNGFQGKFWDKRSRSMRISQFVAQEWNGDDSVTVEQLFFNSPPSVRGYLIDNSEVVFGYYDTVQNYLTSGGSIYKGMSQSQYIHDTDRTKLGSFLIDHLNHVLRITRLSGRNWDAEKAQIESPSLIQFGWGLPCMSPQAVFFDMDGVLYDSLPAYVDAWTKGFAAVGIQVDESAIYYHEGASRINTVKAVFRETCDREPTAGEVETVLSARSLVLGNRGKPPVMIGARELVAEVSATGLDAYVVTSSNRPNLRQDLLNDFGSAFSEEHIIAGDDVSVGKTSPEPYLIALSRAHLTPWQSIVIENSPLGTAAATSAGCYCIAVNTGPLSDQVLFQNGARNIFSGPEQLASYWKSIVELLRL